MTIKELAAKGYAFRSTENIYQVCVALSFDTWYDPVHLTFFAPTVQEAMELAREAAVVDFVQRRLS